MAAGQCTKVDPAAPATAAGLLGCGVMAGFGAAVNTGNVGRGDSVAVIGCGGVGNAAIAGSRIAGATTIIAVDVDDRKLEWATRFGATHTVDARHRGRGRRGSASSPAGSVPTSWSRRSGRPETYEQAFYARDLAGTVVLVGVPTPDLTIELPMIEVFGRGGALKSQLVRRLPAEPRLPDADRPLPPGPVRPRRASCPRRSASATSRRRSSKMHRGEVLRSVVVL